MRIALTDHARAIMRIVWGFKSRCLRTYQIRGCPFGAEAYMYICICQKTHIRPNFEEHATRAYEGGYTRSMNPGDAPM